MEPPVEFCCEIELFGNISSCFELLYSVRLFDYPCHPRQSTEDAKSTSFTELRENCEFEEIEEKKIKLIDSNHLEVLRSIFNDFQTENFFSEKV